MKPAAGTRRFISGIVARGRIFVAADDKVYAFTVPVSSITLKDLAILPGGAFQAGFTNTPGLAFHVLATTNLNTPVSNWVSLGDVSEVSPGHFQFTDTSTPPTSWVYRVRRLQRIKSPSENVESSPGGDGFWWWSGGVCLYIPGGL